MNAVDFKPQTYSIVAEQQADAAAREALLDAAMGPKRRKKSSEKIRRGRKPSEGLSLVVRDHQGRVVGTVRLWDISAGSVPALLLGPLAVDPAIKSSGIGSALMHQAIAESRRLGHQAIILVGDAAYYQRFGFSVDGTGDLAMPGPFEKCRLLGLELVPDALKGACGIIRPTGRKLKSRSAGDRVVGIAA